MIFYLAWLGNDYGTSEFYILSYNCRMKQFL